MSTETRSSLHRVVQAVAALLLASTVVLAGAPAALAGPACPDKPGVCPELLH